MKYDRTIKREVVQRRFEVINVGDILCYGDCDLEVIAVTRDGHQFYMKTQWTGYAGRFGTGYQDIKELVFTNTSPGSFVTYIAKQCAQMPCYDSDCDCVFD